MTTILEKSTQYRRKTATKSRAKNASPIDQKLRARTFKYLSLWDDIYNKWGWMNKSNAEKSDLRHSINIDLFDKYIPPSKLSNEQFSIMRFALELLYNDGILVWSREMAEIAKEEGLRRIYTWWIEHAGLDVEGIEEYGAPEEYVSAIARDRFRNVKDWHTLDSKSLWQLFITVKNRVKSAQRCGISLWKNTASGQESDDNYPF